MTQIDLHVHSSYSDGTDTPAELIDLAISKGLSAFALTDHDTTKGIPEALEYCKQKNAEGINLEVVPGVEISTHFDRSEIHIVGLYINYEDNELNNFLENQLKSREYRNQQVCENFIKLGYNISYDDMKATYTDSVITRAHFADKLVSMGITKDRNEAFDRFLSPGKPCYVPRIKVDTAEAIRHIHNAGGVAILAHPILYHLGKEQMNKLLDYVCNAGLDGIEAVYSTYKTADELYIKRIAKERSLLISGGSDYHGKNKPNISLGTGMSHLFVPGDILDDIKEYIHNGRG